MAMEYTTEMKRKKFIINKKQMRRDSIDEKKNRQTKKAGNYYFLPCNINIENAYTCVYLWT